MSNIFPYFSAEVSGYFEYKKPDSETIYKFELKPFLLDFYKGQKLVKNLSFKEFWQAVDEFDRMSQVMGALDNMNVQEHVER